MRIYVARLGDMGAAMKNAERFLNMLGAAIRKATPRSKDRRKRRRLARRAEQKRFRNA